jgi:ribosomal RNA-processing protein 9
MAKPRVRRQTSNTAGPAKRSRKTLDLGRQDDHIDSSESEEEAFGREPSLDEESEEEEEEPVDVKRVRLAREYLEKLDARTGESSSEEEDSDEEDTLALKLQRERLKKEGALERVIANKLQKHTEALQKAVVDERPALLSLDQAADQWVKSGNVRLLTGHDLTPTCVALGPAGQRFISGSKDHSVFLWDTEKECRLSTLCRPWKKNKTENVSRTDGQALSVALSDDGRFAAVGKRSGLVYIFDVRSNQNDPIKKFEGHKGAVTSLAFRTQTNQLFSASEDRCIRHYNLDEMMYMETLYGHQFGVSGIDCHRKERPVSVGRDRTVRAWKLAEDTHLIFRGGSKIQPAQAVSVIKDDWYVTGHDGGFLSLWMSEKKKAVTTIDNAHGPGHDIVSVTSLKGSDVAVSGSHDGYLRLWKIMMGKSLQERGIEPLSQIPVRGYINSIAVGPKARFCVAAVGQEHRCGRWNRVQGAKNRIAIVNLHSSSEIDDDDPEEDIHEERDEDNTGTPSDDDDSDSD